MGLVKTSITLPGDLLAEAKGVSRNLSALVVEALQEYLRQKKIHQARQSFGAWQNQKETGIEMVKRLRSEGDRGYVRRSD